jgi:hypothetical protein
LKHLADINLYDWYGVLNPLLGPVAELKGLKSSSLDIHAKAGQQQQSVTKVLQNNDLTSLEIRTDSFMEALGQVLKNSEHSLHSLRALAITANLQFNQEATIRTLTAISKLKLEYFEWIFFSRLSTCRILPKPSAAGV